MPQKPPPRKFVPPTLEDLEINQQKLDLNYLFSVSGIDEAEEHIPVSLEWINDAHQRYLEEKTLLKEKIKQAEANAYVNLKSEGLEQHGIAKVTDAAIAHCIHLDSAVIKLHETYSVLVGWVSRLEVLQENLKIKLEAIRTAEATRRRLIEN